MSVIRSVSASELTSGKDMPQDGDQETNGDLGVESSNVDKFAMDSLLSSKAQTLDRFARPFLGSQHGEKRKKSFFASFRLNKKSIGKKKEDHSSSGSDLSHTQEKSDESSFPKKVSLKDDDKNVEFCNASSKQRKRYLNRMSSFVNKVAYKVQNVNESNTSLLRNKLERSQTVTGTDFALQKVECIQFDDNQVPGVMGIRNHGNTCFINAVIQCLSHTDVLAEYFVLDYYKSDLARCNRINSKKYGTRGEITEHLSSLLKSLWVLRYIPDISLNLKNIVEKYEPCYRGSNQHDAAEFLMFILDKVHEDLNTASKRKYKKIKNSYGRPDEIVAAETLANHLRCNSSFVQDVFQAQFRSSLKCPHCLKESNTFDPYLCVSIPIPQNEVLAIFVTVVYLNQQPKQVKIGIRIEAAATIKQLRHTISEDCGINSENLIVTEIDGEGFHRTFADNASVNIIKPTDPVYAIELTPHNTSAIQENGAFIHIIWVNVILADPSDIRFGGACQSQVARDISYLDLQKLLLKEMSTIVTMETLVNEQERGLFLIGLDTGSKNITILEPDLDLPFLHQSVEEALSICHPLAGPSHIKLVLQWIPEAKNKYITDDVDHVDEHSSVEELKKKPPECAPVTLSDCLQLHTSAEMLSCGDAWHCPTCNRKQQVLKRLTLWSAPQILVIHLKRFRQVSLSSNSSKLNTVVNFPLTGFDISDHMASRCNSSTNNMMAINTHDSDYNGANKSLNGVWSPWKRAKKFNTNGNDQIYDLYAICNHHGEDLQGGHYTAVCRNSTNDRWYAFDDFNIEEISQESVVDQDAYILFYQRRSDMSSPCFSEDPEVKHWSYRIPLKTLPQNLKIIQNPNHEKDGEASDEENFVKSSKEKDGETEIPDISCNGMILSTIDKTDGAKIPMIIEKSSLNLENVKVEISSYTEEKKVGSITDIPVKESDANSLESSEKDSDKYIPSGDKISKASTTSTNRKIGDRLPSFMMDTVDTRDIGSIQAIVGSNKDNYQESSCNFTVTSDDLQEGQEFTTPDVRIQPASLEVLASHRYISHSTAIYSAGKVNLRPKSQQRNGSRPSSVSSCSSKSSDSTEVSQEKLMNGYSSENGCSTSSDETPEIRINSTRVHPTHRQPNTNKTPSFVVIRTPTASPRSNISSKGVKNTTNSASSRTRVRETYPSGIKSDSKSSRERTLSYCGTHEIGANIEGDFKVHNNKLLANSIGKEVLCYNTVINDQDPKVNSHGSQLKTQVGSLKSKTNGYKIQVSCQKGHNSDTDFLCKEFETQVKGMEHSKNLVNGYDSRSYQVKISGSARSSNLMPSTESCGYKISKPCLMKYKSEDKFNQYITESSV